MQWRHVKTIFLKEMLDTVRDRRTLFIMILAPIVLLPAMMLLGPTVMNAENKKTREAIYNVVIQGAENGKGLAAFINQDPKLKIVSSSNPNKDLEDGSIQLIVAISPGFDKAIDTKTESKVDLIYKATERLSEIARLKVAETVNAYSRHIVSERLSQEGLEQSILEPFVIESRNLASNEEMGGMFLSFVLPFMIIIWAVVGGMYTAIDIGAGEKERGTLESLLVTPPDRKAIVAGKFLAIFAVASAAITLALASIVLAVKIMPASLSSGVENVKITLPFIKVILILGIACLVTCFMSSLQLALSIYARNFKEAQNYITPLYLAVMIPAMLTQFMQTFKPDDSWFMIPVLNAMLIFKELLIGDISWTHVGSVAVSSVVAIVLALNFSFKTFSKEEIIFRT